MKILGVGPSMTHDPAAALVIDGRIVAAAEEERFIREKHAPDKLPLNAIRFCLDYAKITPADIDFIAFAWSPEAHYKFRFPYLRRKFIHSPDRAVKTILKTRTICRDKLNIIKQICRNLDIDFAPEKIKLVEHHLAHAASCYYFSGFNNAAIMSIDGSGEFTATFLGKSNNEKIERIKEIIVPDSLGLFYATMTEYLGFKSNDGEYKVMGMAPYGNATKINFDHIIFWDEKRKTYRCHDNYVWVKRHLRLRPDKMYSRKMVEEFGPPRSGDDLSEPYIHIAAKTQKAFEEIILRLINGYLSEQLALCGNLCFAGGCALNVSLNRQLLNHPLIKHLWVQPAANDTGTSLGAAVYVAASFGERIKPMEDVYLGPEFSSQEIKGAISESGFEFCFEKDIAQVVAGLLDAGEIVAWFQGRMEWGPRALGNRSILGNPTIKGTADRINEVIKFREKWRPFCPSILKEFASEILGSNHPAPFMTLSFKVNPQWRTRIPEVVHIDGSCRPQVVEERINPKYYQLIRYFYQKSGVPVVINTSLNRRGEPMACSPDDAMDIFKGSGLRYLAIGDFLVWKR